MVTRNAVSCHILGAASSIGKFGIITFWHIYITKHTNIQIILREVWHGKCDQTIVCFGGTISRCDSGSHTVRQIYCKCVLWMKIYVYLIL